MSYGRGLRYLGLVLVALFVGMNGAYGDTHTAASVAESAVQTAYDACSDGDTLSIPAGSAAWTRGPLLPRGQAGEALCREALYRQVRERPGVSWGRLPADRTRAGKGEDVAPRILRYAATLAEGTTTI